jgi:hypothetical protein
LIFVKSGTVQSTTKPCHTLSPLACGAARALSISDLGDVIDRVRRDLLFDSLHLPLRVLNVGLDVRPDRRGMPGMGLRPRVIQTGT